MPHTKCWGPLGTPHHVTRGGNRKIQVDHPDIKFEVIMMPLTYDAWILQTGNVLCRIVFDTSLFVCKIRVPTISLLDLGIITPNPFIHGLHV